MPRIYYPARDEWDSFVEQQPRAHVLQLSAFGELKAAFGWQVIRVALLDDQSKIAAGAQILLSEVRNNPLRMAYIPMGPYIPDRRLESDLWNTIDQELSSRCFMLKWEPGIYAPGEIPNFAACGFSSSTNTIQPPRTILIDLRGTEEEILAQMNQGTRRKIRLCARNGVEIQEGCENDIAGFNQLMTVTAERKNFHGRDGSYYDRAYRLYKPRGYVKLLIAKYEGVIIAGIMAFAVGTTAYYLYGASSNLNRDLMAPHGLQWEAIRWARNRGCTTYDLWGIPDASMDVLEKEAQQRFDGLWGVYGFKRGFGGTVTRSVGAWDKIYQP